MNATEGRKALVGIAVELDKARGELSRIVEGFGDDWPEDMKAGKVAPSVGFVIHKTAQTLLDALGPFLVAARGAAAMTRAQIRREWRAEAANDDDPEAGVPGTETAWEAARILGDGEGMQKLCYVLCLAHFDDELALKLADMGAFLNAGQILTADGRTPETPQEKVLLSKATRLESVLCQDDVDEFLVRMADHPTEEDRELALLALEDCLSQDGPASPGPSFAGRALRLGRERYHVTGNKIGEGA